MKKPVRRQIKKKIMGPKNCYFCEEKKMPHFSDATSLQKFVTERGKIVSRTKNGLCALHQRHLASAIKHARHLALMPFVTRV
jgi:small subunit ribosomal protein S18